MSFMGGHLILICFALTRRLYHDATKAEFSLTADGKIVVGLYDITRTIEKF